MTKTKAAIRLPNIPAESLQSIKPYDAESPQALFMMLGDFVIYKIILPSSKIVDFTVLRSFCRVRIFYTLTVIPVILQYFLFISQKQSSN